MESNKIIAEFMGLETPDNCYFEYLTKEGNRSELTHYILLKYHTSWDWLMPVIKKMADIRKDTHYRLYNTIDDAYNEVVEFIKES
tara:strand:- start:353 stop:607 length:255 start_codon:yes stop_codon:yes gene_type:complete